MLCTFNFKSMDYNFRFFPTIPNLGTFGNSFTKAALQVSGSLRPALLDATLSYLRFGIAIAESAGALM